MKMAIKEIKQKLNGPHFKLKTLQWFDFVNK